jgi:hypothetical protein
MAEASHLTHEDRHRALVERLTADVQPIRRIWPVGVRLGLWMVLEAGVLAWVSAHTTDHFQERLTQPAYAIEIVSFAAAAIISAALALRSAIPGRSLPASEAALAAVLVFAGAMLLSVAQPMNAANRLADFVRQGLPCAYSTGMFAVLPWLGLWWAVRRGVPMRSGLSGVLIGGAALSFSFAMMRVACPSDEPLHLLIWHLLPALILTVLSGLAGIVWLQLRVHVPSRDPA